MKELGNMFKAFFENKQGVMVFAFVIGMIALMYAGFYVIYLLNR